MRCTAPQKTPGGYVQHDALENNVIDTRVCFPSSTRKKKKADIRQQASIKSISSSRAGVANDWLLLLHTLVIIT